jgi:WD40 repeat protein
MKKDVFPWITTLTFSPDGRFLAAGCGHTIKLWRLPESFKAK